MRVWPNGSKSTRQPAEIPKRSIAKKPLYNKYEYTVRKQREGEESSQPAIVLGITRVNANKMRKVHLTIRDEHQAAKV